MLQMKSFVIDEAKGFGLKSFVSLQTPPFSSTTRNQSLASENKLLTREDAHTHTHAKACVYAYTQTDGR